MAWFDEHIARYDGVQGGAPVIAGTRTPVSSIIAKYEIYGGDIHEVLRAQPHLTETQVRAALAYFDDHRADIEADEARHLRALEEFLQDASAVAR